MIHVVGLSPACSISRSDVTGSGSYQLTSSLGLGVDPVPVCFGIHAYVPQFLTLSEDFGRIDPGRAPGG
jgi:hypothetical protein